MQCYENLSGENQFLIAKKYHILPHFTPNFHLLLCMHKKYTEYRFKLWYKLLKIIFYIY